MTILIEICVGNAAARERPTFLDVGIFGG